MKLILSSMLLLAVMPACSFLAKDIDPARLPRADPQLVIHCYLSPQDSVLTAVVARSQTTVGIQVDSNRFNRLPNARVTLSAGDSVIVLRFDPKQAVYRADARLFAIKVGHTYTLTVESADGLRVIARTTVPSPAPVPEVQIDSVINRNTPGDLDYFVQLRWRDIAGELNYYQVAGDNEYGSSYRPLGSLVNAPYRAITQVSFQLDYNDSPFLTDDRRDGQLLTSSRGKLQVYSITNMPTYTPPHTLNVYLLNVNQAYYDYQESVLSQSRNRSNPFAEPTMIRGNVQGALGCFGAYNRVTAHFRLK